MSFLLQTAGWVIVFCLGILVLDAAPLLSVLLIFGIPYAAKKFGEYLEEERFAAEMSRKEQERNRL